MNLLFCFAHPDDESFSGAGTAMKYAAAGARTVLVTATLGQSGKCGQPPVCRSEDLEVTRERELREAVRIIGFDELHLLGYRDRELSEAPPGDVRKTLVAIIRRERPSTVFTFDPNGFNVHPDHVAISRFTIDAIAAAADPRWHSGVEPPYAVPRLLWTPPLPPWDAAHVAEIEREPGVDLIIDVAAWHDRRVAALRAHRTQHLSIDRCFFNRPDLHRILDTEIWRQGYGPALSERPTREL
ncbi:MAG: PIG-L family deacetylase [Acidobacteria bacterium]|nr:PIG-L family deacetylase [Acidobacteriota bacterium]